MKKLIPIACIVLVSVSVVLALFDRKSDLQAQSDPALTQKQFAAIAERYNFGFINLVQRIEALEKKTGVKPPKDSLKIEKKK